MHPALLHQSYSSFLTLHSCPRKLELDKCSPTVERETNVDFAFGHAVGAGVQALFMGYSQNRAVWLASLAWNLDLYEGCDDGKKKKDFFHVVLAIKLFVPIAAQYAQEWDVASINGQAAIELGFRITTSEGLKYRGFVDAVLVNRRTGQLMVIELKTTGNRTPVEESYRNSGQAIGYSIIVDAVAQSTSQERASSVDNSSFYVMYLIYSSTNMEYTPMPFPKSRLQRARWINQLLMDWEQVKMYSRAGLFPMHGESCYNYFRPCKYFGICELSNESLGLVKPEEWQEPEREAEGSYTVEVTLDELVGIQLEKVNAEKETANA